MSMKLDLVFSFSNLKEETGWIRWLLLHSHMRAPLNTGTFRADHNCEVLIKLFGSEKQNCAVFRIEALKIPRCLLLLLPSLRVALLYVNVKTGGALKPSQRRVTAPGRILSLPLGLAVAAGGQPPIGFAPALPAAMPLRISLWLRLRALS